MILARASRPENAGEIAARLFPGPDPVDFAKREAIRHLAKLDRALNHAIELRGSAYGLVFPELARLWIQPTKLEILVSLLQAELATAVAEAARVLDLLASARVENDLRNCDERAIERAQRGA